MARSNPRVPAGAIPLALLLLLLSACNDVVIHPAGQIARQQRDIVIVSTALMLLIIVPVMILTVVFAWHYRQGNREATYDPEFDHSTTLELVIWSAPLLIIIALGALTWSSTHVLDPFRRIDPKSRAVAGETTPLAAGPPLRIEVVALDWKWLFIYPEQGIATVNELALPVDREVRFDLTSTNMMNAFYAPTLAGMLYTMPGMRSTLHAVLDEPVESEGFSANFSGAGFSDMRFRLHGLPQADFDRWVANVRGSGTALQMPAYMNLVRPSEKVPPMALGAVEPDLFRRIVERCVEPGKPCTSQLDERGQGMGGTHANGRQVPTAMPPGPDSAPLHGDKPKGAIFKSPEEQRPTGVYRTAPAHPEKAPGVRQPNSPKNRDLTLTTPAGTPGGFRPERG